MAINKLTGPLIIISASGMCEAGRMLHHLKLNCPTPGTPSFSSATRPRAPAAGG